MKLAGSDKYISGGKIPESNYNKTNIMKHEIINKVIKEVEAKSYLEIGYGNGDNYNLIDLENKYATDPNYSGYESKIVPLSSDSWYESMDAYVELTDKSKDIDVVFIDGDHTSEQVRKDISNALKCNAKAIIIHDVIPHSKEMQEVPRIQKEWTGDVWRAVVGFIEKHPDVKVETYRSDYGLTVIYPNGVKSRKYFENLKMTYEDFKENEIELLNIID